MSMEVGSSYSSTSKILSKFSEMQILKKKMLPKRKKVSRKRLWHVKDIIDWISEDLDETRLCSAPPSTNNKVPNSNT